MDGLGGPDVVVERPTRMRWLAVALFVLFAAGNLWLVGRADSWPGSAWAGLAAVAFVVLAWRSAHARVVCSADGVTAYMDVRTRRYRWSEIERFEERQLLGIGVRLTNGTWRSVLYYATLGDRPPEAVTASLQAALERHRAARGPVQTTDELS